MAAIRFYLDENVHLAVAEQLHQRGIDAITVRSLEVPGEENADHLLRAAAMGCVLCTHDINFYELADSGVQHTGIIIGQFERHMISYWIKGLSLVHAVHNAEEMHNRIEFL